MSTDHGGEPNQDAGGPVSAHPGEDQRSLRAAVRSLRSAVPTTSTSELHEFTRHYPLLRGGLVAPWVLPILVLSGVKSGLVTTGWPSSFIAATALAVVLTVAARAGYARRYGRIRRRLDDRRLVGWTAALIAIPSLAVAMSALGGLWAPLAPAFGLRGVLLGAAILLWCRVALRALGSRGPLGVRWYGLALIAVGLLPLGWLDPLDGRHPFTQLGAMSAMAAGLLAVLAVSGHRAFGPGSTGGPEDDPDGRDGPGLAMSGRPDDGAAPWTGGPHR